MCHAGVMSKIVGHFLDYFGVYQTRRAFPRGRESTRTVGTVAKSKNYSRILAYRTGTCWIEFSGELYAQKSGDTSRVGLIKVITIEQAYVVTTFQAYTRRSR